MPHIKQPGTFAATKEQLARFWLKVNKTDDCWLWSASANFKGYGVFRLHGRTQLAHRVSWQSQHGTIPESFQVLHKCDTPSCVRPEHLFIGTAMDNTRDMMSKARQRPARGVRVHTSKLTEENVRAIRSIQRATGSRFVDLARRFQVSAQTIGDIIRRKFWKHVD